MESYHELLRDVLVNGNFKMTRAVDPTTGKQLGSVAVFGRQWAHNLNEGFPLLTTKKVFWKGVVEELLWFIRSETNVTSLQEKGVKIWNAWAYDPEQKFGGRKTRLTPDEKEGDVGPVYGFQWRTWQAPEHLGMMSANNAFVSDAVFEAATAGEVFTFPIDQLQNTIDTLRKNPDDRRMIVSAWNPADIDKMGLPPCHYAFQLGTEVIHHVGCQMGTSHQNYFPDDPTIRWKCATECTCNILTARDVWPQRRLNMLVHMRSADAFLGVPFNIASYALLARMIAWITNLLPGRLTFSFGDLHIYENHFEQVKEQLAREPKPLPSLLFRARIGSIDEFTADDIMLEGYDHHPAIKAPVGV